LGVNPKKNFGGWGGVLVWGGVFGGGGGGGGGGMAAIHVQPVQAGNVGQKR